LHRRKAGANGNTDNSGGVVAANEKILVTERAFRKARLQYFCAKVAMLGASNERCLKQKQSADNTQRSSGLTDDDRLYQSKHLNDAMTMPSGVATVDYQ